MKHHVRIGPKEIVEVGRSTRTSLHNVSRLFALAILHHDVKIRVHPSAFPDQYPVAAASVGFRVGLVVCGAGLRRSLERIDRALRVERNRIHTVWKSEFIESIQHTALYHRSDARL